MPVETKEITDWSWVNYQRELALSRGTCANGWREYSPSHQSCRGYHAAFPFLQELELVSGPGSHLEFYTGALQAISGPDKPILVCGLATPLMAIVAHQACPESPMTILDICPTPLLACKEALPKTAGYTLIQQDARNLDLGGSRVSAVVTDAFLTRFDDSERKIVLKRMENVLAPGGALVTTWKIGDGKGSPDALHYGDDLARREFIENVVKQARARNYHLTMDLLSEAFDYAQTMTSFGGQTLDQVGAELREFFPDVRLETSPPVYDVTMREYARIIAYK